MTKILIHSPDKLIYVTFPVASVTSFNIMVSFLLQTTKGSLQLERPEEVICLSEVRSNSHYLMNQIFNANNSMLPQGLALNINYVSKKKWIIEQKSNENIYNN